MFNGCNCTRINLNKINGGGENDDWPPGYRDPSDFLAWQKAGRFQENDSLEHACVILRAQKVKSIDSSVSSHACLDSILQMILN